MSQQWFDPSTKWLLEERGAALLWLAGARSVVSCKAIKAEVVQPRKLPDGLLEVRCAGEKEARLILVEVATYPEPRVAAQVSDDLRLVRQTRGVMADGLVLCLCPKGKYRVPDRLEGRSGLGWSTETLSWKVIELWTLSAAELLSAPDVGVVPWATLAKHDGTPEVLLQWCRDRIDREGGDQRANLLAVSQVFASLHYDRPEWLDILGGRKMFLQMPLIQEVVQESERATWAKAALEVLGSRFDAVPPAISAGLEQVKEQEGLIRLTRQAVVCASLQAFEDALREELPKPPPASTRGKRKPRKPAE